MQYMGGKSRIARSIAEIINTAPPDFVCVWEKPFTRTLDVNKGNQFKVKEKLFTCISKIK